VSSRIRQHIRNNVIGYIALFLVVTGGTAQALAGSNTVFSDDIVAREVKTADLGYGAVIANRLAANSVRSGRVVDGSLGGVDIGDDSLTGDNIAESSLSEVPQATNATSASSATNASNASALGGTPASGFMRMATKWKKVDTVGENLPVEIGHPACSADRECTASIKCDPGDVLLSGGYDSIDNGTRLIAAFPFNANGNDHKYVMHWANNSTVDTVRLVILCADQ
jgi:hypothetical protein